MRVCFGRIVPTRLVADHAHGFPINVRLLPREFATYSKPTSRDNHSKASYPSATT